MILLKVGGIDYNKCNTIFIRGILYVYVIVKRNREEGEIIVNVMQRMAEMLYMFINSLV